MDKLISFSQRVKEEIISKKYTNDRVLSIIYGFIISNSSYRISNKKEMIVVKLENSKIMYFLKQSLSKLLNIESKLTIYKKSNLKKNISYELEIDYSLLNEKTKFNYFNPTFKREYLKDQDLLSGFFSGLFLASGSCNSPTSSNYHLEFSLFNQKLANKVLNIIKENNFNSFDFKSLTRYNKQILYLKKSDQIVDFLILLGATDSCLYFEDIRVTRDLLNNENRISNIDIANYAKCIKRAKEDIKLIEIYDKKYNLNSIKDRKLKMLLLLRKENSDISLNELTKLMNQKLNVKITKSYVNHTLRAFRNQVSLIKKNV